MRDVDFISAKFVDYEIPRDKKFLLKYFTTNLQVAFLRYFLMCDSTRLFNDHTGYFCSERLRFRFIARFRKLVDLHKKSKNSMTEDGLETLQLLESGQYPLTSK